jgi:hypothetical protein
MTREVTNPLRASGAGGAGAAGQDRRPRGETLAGETLMKSRSRSDPKSEADGSPSC